MDKNDFRGLIKHCYLMGKSTVQTCQWLEKCYPVSVPSKTALCRWYADFKCGHTDTNDATQPDRPNEEVSLENVKQVLKIGMNNCKVKVREIAEMVNISIGSAYTILHEKLSMKRVFCFSNGCRMCSQWNKSNDKSTIQRAVCPCLRTINRIFCVGM
ncbi:hypothetical protein X975_15828, partial [Stegodyphus mimosarum]